VEAKDGWDFSLGWSASFHPFITGDATKFKNKITDDGRIVSNFRGSFNYTETEGHLYRKSSFHFGKDCIGSNAFGYTYSGGIIRDEVFFGLVAGGYFIDAKEWRSMGMGKYWLSDKNLKDLGFVPVLGAEIQMELFRHKNMTIDFNNQITPWLSNHAIMLSWEF